MSLLSSSALSQWGLHVFSSWVCPWPAAGLQFCQASGCDERMWDVSGQLSGAQSSGERVWDDPGVGGRGLLGLLLYCSVGKALTRVQGARL